MDEYIRHGSQELGRKLHASLVSERGLNPMVIPVGGSNALGTWGYLQCVEEIRRQVPDVTDIVMVCI